MKNDLRYAFRMLRNHPWFALAVIVTLALGIGINTTVFTLVNAVLFKPVPLPNGARIVTVALQNLTKPDQRPPLSYPDFLEMRAQNRSFEGLEGLTRAQATISEASTSPERFNMARVTPGLFGLLHTPPVIGRPFSPDDGKPGAAAVALISDSVWNNRYGRDPGVVGRAVRINGNPATIVGVMPPAFRFPNNEDVWMPLQPTADMEKRSNRGMMVFGLLKRGTPIEAAGADLAVIAQRLAKEFPDSNKEYGAIVRTFHDTFNNGSIRMVFLTMFGAVGFVLLIACANVACLMLSRAIARRREIAVRAAVGASRWQLIRQLLVESVLLSSLGGLVGLGLALGGVHAFDVATRDVGKPYWIQFQMDWVVFGYFAIVSVLCGLLFGLAPALRASRVDLNTALKDGTAAAGDGRSGGKLIGVLVVLQFALTVVLLAGAGLMVRGFFAAQTVNDFVPAARIFTARISLPDGKESRYADAAARLRFYDDLLERLRSLPSVTHATVSSNLPGLGSGQREIELEGKPVENPQNGVRVSTGVHSPGYLAMIGLPIIAGREFNANDGLAGKEAAVVTREFATKHWPNQSAVGARFRFLQGQGKMGPWITVVGVSGDIVQRGQDPDAPPLVFTPLRQEPTGWMGLVVRTAGDPAALAPEVRAVVQGLDQDLPLFDVRPLSVALQRNHWFLVVFGSLFFSFALIALLMASVGLYAVVAQATGRRTREIGIRMALGATAARIVRLVLSRGLTQLGIGLVVGLGGAFAATGLMAKARLLFRVSPQDPLVFAAATAMLLAIGVLACWIPARRAARIAPTVALRVD
jgi:putative ABC transport system permease protein